MQPGNPAIQIQCFGVLQDVCGGATHALQAAGANPSVADALAAFARQCPAFAPHLPYTACALGDEFVDRDTRLKTGDVLVLLPPVSGG